VDRPFIPSDYIPILIQSVVAFGFVILTMTVTHFIGGKRKRIHSLRKEENFNAVLKLREMHVSRFLSNIF